MEKHCMVMGKLHSKMEMYMLVNFITECCMVSCLSILGKGKFTWASGVVYEGEFTYNKIEGEGTYTWPEGSSYTGTVVNGLRHG